MDNTRDQEKWRHDLQHIARIPRRHIDHITVTSGERCGVLDQRLLDCLCNRKEITDVSHNWSIVGPLVAHHITGPSVTDSFPSPQRVGNTASDSISWRHHAQIYRGVEGPSHTFFKNGSPPMNSSSTRDVIEIILYGRVSNWSLQHNCSWYHLRTT